MPVVGRSPGAWSPSFSHARRGLFQGQGLLRSEEGERLLRAEVASRVHVAMAPWLWWGVTKRVPQLPLGQLLGELGQPLRTGPAVA